jgi:hypothetical protein
MAIAVTALAATVARADEWGARQVLVGELVLSGIGDSPVLPLTLHDRLLLFAAASDGDFSRGERRLAVAEGLRRLTLAASDGGAWPASDWALQSDPGIVLRTGDVHAQIRYLGEKLAEAGEEGDWESEPTE